MVLSRENLMQRLDELGIRSVTRDHAPLFTVEDSKSLRGEIPGTHSKNLFLKDKKGALFLVVAEEDAVINMKRFHQTIGSARLSFGKPDLLLEVLGTTPGSVSPFTLINDTNNRVNVILDAKLMEREIVNFHPLTNEATTSLSPQDLLTFIASCGHEPQIVQVASEETSGDVGE
ncbi:MAG: prolyl-tRNA synthetase associated domain-containing protein [Rhizobiales bacterium]|nr:prolyl-tRNA synthetase associated domain-containing protein [Hyphomicrobiales bacterium]